MYLTYYKFNILIRNLSILIILNKILLTIMIYIINFICENIKSFVYIFSLILKIYFDIQL